MLLVGTSGWHYKDWVGPFYPLELAGKPGAWLEHYAMRFGTVEVNSTFYRTPSEATVRGWIEKAERLGGPFEFSVKAPQDVTHAAMVQGDEAMVRDLLAQFKEAVCRPLAEARMLGAVLLQLSPHVHGGPEQLRVLDAALHELRGPALAVEFRHRTWLEARQLAPAAEELLRRHDAALCAVDGPGFPPMLRAIGTEGYVRFHGRRADAWFAGRDRAGEGEPDARYDYLYSAEQLAPWARVLRENEARFEKVRVYFNNHPQAKAAVNAGQMMGLLGLGPPPRAPRPPPPPRLQEGQRSLESYGA